MIWKLGHLDFEIVSDFDIRISDFSLSYVRRFLWQI